MSAPVTWTDPTATAPEPYQVRVIVAREDPSRPEVFNAFGRDLQADVPESEMAGPGLDVLCSVEELARIRELKEDWDEEGAAAPSTSAIERATSLLMSWAHYATKSRARGLPRPVVSPLPSGGIDIMW